MAKIRLGVVSMKDIDEFMEYCKGLNHQGLINLIEGMYTQDIMNQMSIEKLEKALYIACFELEGKDSELFDLYNLYVDVQIDTKDRHEWKRELMDRAEEDE